VQDEHVVQEKFTTAREATPTGARAPRGLRVVGLCALVVAIAVVVFGIVERRQNEVTVAQWTEAQAIPEVAVLTPKSSPAVAPLVLPGNIQAWYEAPMYARVSGYLKMWYFDYGAHVKKGDVLAEIDTPDLDAQLAAAQAKLNSALAVVNVRKTELQFAESTYNRWRESPTGVVSEQETESKQADYGSAKARLNAANAEVAEDQGEVDRLNALEGFKKIIAPFGGVVTARETDIGALINAGSGTSNEPELFRMADVSKMRIFVQVPQQQSAGIAPGQEAEVHLPQYPGKIFKATVATTSDAINMEARTLLVELHVDNPDGLLQPGAYAQVVFRLPSNPDVLRIPTSALVFRKQGLQVATLGPGDKIELKSVTLGRNLGTDVEVVSGLSASDRVVDSPPDSLAPGDLVHVASDQTPDRDPQTTTRTRRRREWRRGYRPSAAVRSASRVA
jgi:RND family efflux transporter MFP subunit